MKFSVIIPTLNEEEMIENLISKTRNLGSCEIIVVDGGSQDLTTEKASGADQILNSPPGRAIQQNLGAKSSSGDYLLFLHADCFPEPGTLEAIEKTFQDERIIAGCFHQKIEAQGIRFRLLETGNALRVRILKWMYGDQGIFIRREAFEKLGGFPEIRLMEDLYFSKQLKRAGKIKILNPPIHVSARRWKQVGVIRQTLKNWSLVLRAHMGHPPERLARDYPDVR